MSVASSPAQRRRRPRRRPPPPPPLSELIFDTLVKSKFDKTERPFSPEGSIDKYITRASITRALGANDSTVDEDLIDFILKKAKRVFAIAIYSRLENDQLRKAMEFFKSHSMSDDGLPFVKAQWGEHAEEPPGLEDPAEPPHHSYDSNESADGDYDDGEDVDETWSKISIDGFCKEQWAFCAPVFSTDTINHDLEPDTVIPITAKDTISMAQGSFGSVYRCQVHKSHLHTPENSEGTNCFEYVAVKEVQREVHQDRTKMVRAWENEARILWGMNSLNQKHIVKFITAFRRGQDDHYLMFEWANGGNLRNLWNLVERPALTGDLVRETMVQLCGLAQAIENAHYPGDDRLYRHGDLKPENILWYTEERGERKKRIGTLKIGDWGLAKRHDIATEHRSNKTTTEYGTRRYESPEEYTCEHTGLKAPASLKRTQNRRSRLYDIWAMGCIAMEFLVWLMYGPDELKRFNDGIKTQFSDHSPFYEIVQDDEDSAKDTPRAKVHWVVEKWMDHMAKDPACAVGTTALGNLLELIRNRLLVVKLPVRMGTSPDLSPTIRSTKVETPSDSSLHVSDSTSNPVHTMNIPEISITDLEPTKPSANLGSEPEIFIKRTSGGWERALAIGFHTAMLEISGKDEGLDYWLTCLPGLPPDQDPGDRPIIAQDESAYQTEYTVSDTGLIGQERRQVFPLRPETQTPGTRTERTVS
ncbi:hypothetical protein Neosp_009838 [[Neocosmospora] mangrovei]